MAIRVVLTSLQAAANRYKRHVVPLISLSIDFYVRVFVRVYTSAADVKKIASQTSMIYECIGCESVHYQP
jgi:tRNA (guanine26-N2/guanine27-N2)-dimethyltransferase